MGAAYWLSRSGFPRSLMHLNLVVLFMFFLAYFPDKGVLPVWLRSLVGY
jgi:hypothetical protein